MTGTREMLERHIARAKRRIEELENNKELLSKAGHWDLGWWKGRLTVLEDWLDELNAED